jgi:superoxide dismutase, Fe-Mn family
VWRRREKGPPPPIAIARPRPSLPHTTRALSRPLPLPHPQAPNAGGAPTGELASAIEKTFGSLDKFKEDFSNAAATVFGSGWAWLVVDKTSGTPVLKVAATPNQDTPAMTPGQTPILGLDVWEHAYYLKYQNKRLAYINAWWNVVNWAEVARMFAAAQ